MKDNENKTTPDLYEVEEFRLSPSEEAAFQESFERIDAEFRAIFDNFDPEVPFLPELSSKNGNLAVTPIGPTSSPARPRPKGATANTIPVTLRLPNSLLDALRHKAKVLGIGYQTLAIHLLRAGVTSN